MGVSRGIIDKGKIPGSHIQKSLAGFWSSTTSLSSY
jgi:hypothetical protein